jgi:NADH-quinone oxidoreductase subunit I
MSESRKSLPGAGLIKGLAVTARTMTRRSVTHQYPDEAPSLPPRSRGVIALLEENCTSCMLCARECPDWCIYIDSHKETIPAPPGGRERTRNVLDRFAIDFSLCMYCGICIEVCPFDALFWSPEFEYSEFDIKDLLHEKDKLRDWMWTVPAPPALDASAEEPKEIATARRAAEKAARAAGATAGTLVPGTSAAGTSVPGTARSGTSGAGTSGAAPEESRSSDEPPAGSGGGV